MASPIFQNNAAGVLQPYDTLIQNVKDQMATADTATTQEEKRAAYNKAFKTMQTMGLREPLTNEDKALLYRIFEQYASKTLYNIDGLEENGFPASAKVMQLSLLLQFNDLGLTSDAPEWMLAKDLDTLIENYQIRAFSLYDFSLDVLTQNLKDEQQPVLKDTIVRLAYSLQNCQEFNRPKNTVILKMHESLDKLAKRMIQSPAELGSYYYNRAAFMAGLSDPGNWRAKIASYDLAEKQYEIAMQTEPNNLDLKQEMLQKKAQTLNMKAKITLDGKTAEMKCYLAQNASNTAAPMRAKEMLQDAMDEALDLWFQARAQYLAMDTPTDPEKLWTHQYLIHNNLSFISFYLATRYPENADKLREAKKYADSMDAFVKESVAKGRPDGYFQGYLATIQFVNSKVSVS